ASVHLGGRVACALAREITAPLPRPALPALHLISWNLHGTPLVAPMSERLARVSQVVLAHRPDLLLLQEVWFRGDADRLREALTAAFDAIEDPPEIMRHL